MPNVKQEVQELLDQLPDNCDLEDIQYHLYVLQKVARGLENAKQGRVYTQEELEERMAKWAAE